MVGWITAGLVLAALCARSEYEKRHFSVEGVEILTDRVKRDCRLVFLSDLHNNEFGTDNEKLLDAIAHVKPDLILVGGDMMICKGKPGTEIPLRLLTRLAARYPVYCGNGNHETRMNREREIYADQYDQYAAALREAGVVYLADASCPFRDDLMITGLDLEERFYEKFKRTKMEASYIRERVGEPSGDRYQIMLCHSPMYFQTCRAWGADLTLAGHFHGGTIRLPVLGGVMTPQYQFFLPWCAGTFEEEGRHMVVSRGLGTHSINLRLNDKPQVVVIDLKRRWNICESTK